MPAVTRRAVLRADWRARWVGMVAAAGQFGAYAVAVWAMAAAPLALGGAAAATAILFALLIGGLVFGGRMDRGHIIAAARILARVMLSRL